MTQDERNRDTTEDAPQAEMSEATTEPMATGQTEASGEGSGETAIPSEIPASDGSAPPGTPVEDSVDAEPSSAPAPSAGSGAGSMIIGGVLAAAIGAGAALVFLPEGWRRGDTAMLSDRLSALETRPQGVSANDLAAALTSMDERLSTVEARIGAIEGRSGPDLTPITDRLNALESGPDGLTEQDLNAAIGTLSQRIDRIEAGLDDQARAAVDSALAEARTQIDARAAELSTREETVAQAQERIAARAALAELIAAAESGTPAAGALATLSGFAGDAPALAPLAQGLPTLAGLQEAFAPAARAALAIDGPVADAPLADRLVDFLRSQTGARSLAPREGEDTDAVLSRAEAALRAGDLPVTLAELDTLSDNPAQAMSDWRAQAEIRLDALAALDDMQTRLNGNED